MIKSTLVISTYNWPEALELVLLSVKKQTLFPTEVIIADDGSKRDTKELIEKIKEDFPVPLIHIWHEDKGFRKSEILNKAIAKAKGDYIIGVDGDCILHKNFIQNHLESVEDKTYLYGSRVNIQASLLPILFKNRMVSFSYFASGLRKRNRNIYMPFLGTLFYKKKNELSPKLRGCNLSYWKKDFIKVNGYNEDMTGWGREDSELIIRMLNTGVFSKRLKFKAIVYHIYHKEKPKERLNINDAIQQNTIINNSVWITNGIDKYLDD